jgi:glycosyltransferase involved in cell wall biosynthesis
MKFSIVTISYNQSKYLTKCIESVLSQDIKDLEYIVVDPGSTDRSREIISSYPQIKKVFKPDRGPSDGLINGFNMANGDYYGFINADDYLLPNALKKLELKILKDDIKFLSGKGLIKKDTGYEIINPTVLTKKDLLYRSSIIFQQSTFFHSDLYKATNGFNFRNKTCWDYELYIDMLNTGVKHEVFDELLAVFRVHDESITGSGRLNDIYIKELERIFYKNKGRDYNILDKCITFLSKINRLI